MTRLFGAAALVCLAAAHPASALQATQTVGISAPPARVWTLIGSFEGIHDWLPGAASSPATNDSMVGSVRVITLKSPGNPTVTEKLTARQGTSYTYEILKVDPKVLPVTGYSSTISVVSSGAGSTITWRGSFQPAGGASDADAERAVTATYRAGLNNIKALLER